MQLRSVSGMNIPQGRVTVTGRPRVARPVPSPGTRGCLLGPLFTKMSHAHSPAPDRYSPTTGRSSSISHCALRTRRPRWRRHSPPATVSVAASRRTRSDAKRRRCPVGLAINKGARKSARDAACIYIPLRRQRQDAGSAQVSPVTRRMPASVPCVRLLLSSRRCPFSLRRRECEFSPSPDGFPNDRRHALPPSLQLHHRRFMPSMGFLLVFYP